MTCANCGASVTDGLRHCPNCGAALEPPGRDLDLQALFSQEAALSQPPVERPAAEQPPKKARRKPFQPPLWARIVLRCLSAMLSLALFVTALATAGVLDLRRLLREDGLEHLVGALLIPDSAPAVRPIPGAAMIGGEDLEELAAQLGENGLSTQQIVDTVFQVLEENYKEELPFTKDQVLEFYQRSNVGQVLTEKVSGYMTDALAGTQNTQITRQDVLDLLEHNEALVEEVFQVQVDDQLCQQVLQQLDVESLDRTIREQVVAPIVEAEVGPEGQTLAEVMAFFSQISSDWVVWALLGLAAVVLLLLFLTNWSRPDLALRWAGGTYLAAGVVLSVPLALVQLAAIPVSVAGPVLQAAAGRLAPVHYGTAVLGLALLIAASVVGAIFKARQPGRAGID